MRLKQKQLCFIYLILWRCAWQSLLHIVMHGRLTEWNADTNSLAAVKPCLNHCIVPTKDALLPGLTRTSFLYAFPLLFTFFPPILCTSNDAFLQEKTYFAIKTVLFLNTLLFYIHVLAFAYAFMFPLLSLLLLFQYKCKGNLWRSCDEKVGP